MGNVTKITSGWFRVAYKTFEDSNVGYAFEVDVKYPE